MTEESCENCGHPFEPHILIRVAGEHEGGYVLCHIRECPCVAEWFPKPGVTDAQIRKLFE